MNLKLIFTTSLLTTILSGCSSIYHIDAKPIQYPKTSRSGVHFVESQADLSRTAWWKSLNDPILNELIANALSCNDKIKASYATIEQAQAQLKAAQFAWLPTLNAAVNGFRGGTWNTSKTLAPPLSRSPLFNDIKFKRFHGYYTGFVPQYNLNILANIFNVKSAKGSLAMEEADSQSTKLSIVSQMTGTYFMLLTQREQLRAEKSLVASMKNLKKLEKVRFSKGASDITTVVNLDQQIAQEETKIPQIKAVIGQSENTIHLLLNQNPGPVVTGKNLNFLQMKNLIPKNLPSTVLKNRPDIMLAAANVEIACAEVGVAFSAFFPALSLTGLFGKASLDLTNFLKLSTNLWVVDASASLKLLDASSYQNIKAAKAGFRSTYYSYLETIHAALTDVDTSLSNAYNSKLAYLDTEKAFRAAEKSYSIASTQYKAGSTDYRTVVNAKINLERMRLALIQEKADLLDNIVQVYTSVAGGYEVG